MIRSASRAAAIIISLTLAGSASAQAPATSAPTKTAPAEKKADVPRTAASLECSKQADAKGLHGDARRKFRSECKKTGGKTN